MPIPRFTIDRKITIAVILAMFCQGAYLIWDTSAAYAQMTYLTGRVAIMERKSDIYDELLQRLTRVEDRITATNDKIDYMIKKER